MSPESAIILILFINMFAFPVTLFALMLSASLLYSPEGDKLTSTAKAIFSWISTFPRLKESVDSPWRFKSPPLAIKLAASEISELVFKVITEPFSALIILGKL
mgnify:CR=1 FL=1